MLKVIIFDFDGVIIESMDIKTNAFKELFKEFPEHLEEIVEYHLKNGGVSRYKKFSYIYSNILKQPLTEKKLEQLGEAFSNRVLQEMLKCPFVKGAREFMEEYSKKVKLFIASGTPEEELQYIVFARGLSYYFKGVYGTPARKSEIIQGILKNELVKKNEALFVGDSTTDYEAARTVGVLFIARVKDSFNPFIGFKVPMVYDLEELNNLLKNDINL